MVNFNGLSEGEKFAFSKDFLIRYKTIKKLKPALTSERDVLMLVAQKFYGGNIRVVNDCIRFMDSKTKITSLETIDLDDAVDEYKKKLEDNVKTKQEEINKKTKEQTEKTNDYNLAVIARNKAKNKVDEAKGAVKSHGIIKGLAITGLVLAGISLIVGIGGLAGALTIIGNLTFTQITTLAFLCYGGYWLYGKIKPWFSGIFKSKADKRNKKLEDANKKYDESGKTVEKEKTELAKIITEKSQAENEYNSANAQAQSENISLEKYRKTNNFDKKLTLAEISIRDAYQMAMSRATSDADKINLEDWYSHFEGSLYANAYLGQIRTEQDIQKIVSEAKQKFREVSNPLAMNSEYNDANVKSRTDSRTNRPLEEIYQAI